MRPQFTRPATQRTHCQHVPDFPLLQRIQEHLRDASFTRDQPVCSYHDVCASPPRRRPWTRENCRRCQFSLILILTDTTLQLKNLIPMITTWAISAAVTDVLIALSLVWTLRGMKTSFKDTDRLLRRIMILSVQNGCTTALASIGAMIASLVMPFRSISVIFTYMLGPLYFLTLVSNLNLRGSSKSSSRGWSSGRNNTVGGTTSIVINGIRVERTAVTTVDPSNSELELEGRKDREDDGSVHHKQQDLGVGVGGFRQNIHFNGDA